jgi:hypothetical protein
MSGAEVSMIMDRGLTADEKAKLNRLQYQIFMAPGRAVRVCEGTGEGDNRMIRFYLGIGVGPPLFSLPAAQFLAASDEELRRMLQ